MPTGAAIDRMSLAKELAFVAYSSRDDVLTQIISESVSRVNSLPIAIRYEPWTFNDVPGNPIISPVIERIEQSSFIVADITYLNLNVVYETGFAIGRKKRTFLIRYNKIEGDKTLAREAGIFDTLGYYEFGQIDDLKNRLSSHIDTAPLPFGSQ